MTVRLPVVAIAAICLAACGGSSPPAATQKPAAAKVDSPKAEADLTTVTLTPEAEKHLDLKIADTQLEAVERSRTIGGDVTAPPGKVVVISAPVAGTLVAPANAPVLAGKLSRGQTVFELIPLQQGDRDLRAATERDAAEADARLTLAEQKLKRLEGLLKEGSVSARAVEEARTEVNVARAAAEAAKKQLSALGRLPVGSRGEIALAAPFDGTIVRLLGSPGQTVAAGSPVAEISQVSTIWIRVPLFAGELATLDLAKPAQVAHLGQESSGPWRRATRVTGPPTADPAAATIDLFFEAANADNALRLGERVSVRLVLSGDSQERAILVPASAVVYDVHGGTWVYQNTGPHVFVRRRVELGGRSGESVVVRRGLPVGVKVVTAGAAELYGTEFFVSK